MSVIAIIPARSGSKGLKDKNIRICGDKPLLAYTVEAAMNSGIFDCIHLSTDSEKYASIGKKYGADVPFLRSAQTASDEASSWSMVEEVLDNYEGMGKKFNVVALLQPTSPLRDVDDIKAAYSEYIYRRAKCIVSVCEMEHSPLWSNKLPEDLSMDGFIKENGSVRRQELDKYYRLNGAIYIVDTNFLKEGHMIYRKGCYAYIMDRRKSIDIDTELDFKIAEYVLKSSNAEKMLR